uniref:ORF1 n=1 Tax=Macaque picobirnavirus 9 TaxID=2078825 RepID=A0A2L1FE65_9VIRU|nr:ORF1 [Macaque picobirnavirus 9]
MTTLGLDYLKHQEQSRSNLANERETNRANLAKEGENLRHNTATEEQAKAELAERVRSNQATESLTAIRDAATKAHYERSDAESQRANMAREDENQRANIAKETENKRSNEMNELINNLKNTEGSSYYQTKLLGDQVYNKLISSTSNPDAKKYLEEQKAKLEKETNKRRYADRIYDMYKTIWGGAAKAVGQAMGKS